MRIKPGWLNQRVTIQSPEIGQDELGQPLTSWTTTAEVWASITDTSGREYVAAGGLQNAALTKVLIRYRSGVVPAMRVLHGSEVYNIEAVLGQDRVSLMLMCRRMV